MVRLYWFGLLGFTALPLACGPDRKPEPPCDGPTFKLFVSTEDDRPLPPDTRLNVRYGGNHEGEPYVLGDSPRGQAVFCEEDPTQGGGANDPELAQGGQSGSPATTEGGASGVWKLVCRLYTQGPARVDVSASGYEPIVEQDLLLDDKQRCRLRRDAVLKLLVDAGTE